MSHGFGKLFLRFWRADRGLSVFVTFLVAVVFVLPAFGQPGRLATLISDLTFSALLVSGALALPQRRGLRWGVPPIAATALVIHWLDFALPGAGLTTWRELSTLVTLALFAAVVAGQVYRDGPVTTHRIQGAVGVYLLLGLAWASAYQLLHGLQPGAFTGAIGAVPDAQTWIYYSFVTLTTMGYGDIVPAHPAARSLAITEALTGQLYIATTLARLVALHVGTRRPH